MQNKENYESSDESNKNIFSKKRSSQIAAHYQNLNGK